jgi:hypothetical protein
MNAKAKPTNGNGSWWRSQITVGNAINFGAIIIACTGFYFNTNSTLADHSKAIDRIEKLISVHEVELRRVEKNEVTERDKTRTEFLNRAEKMADGFSELNKRMAVAETKYDAIRDELIKIGRQLENVTVRKR